MQPQLNCHEGITKFVLAIVEGEEERIEIKILNSHHIMQKKTCEPVFE